jgi:hypothetical protein
MKPAVWALPLGLYAVLSAAQNAPAMPGGTVQNAPPTGQTQETSATTAIAPGGIIPAELSKSLDAKKAKPGDRIEARTAADVLSHGQIMLPRNTRIVGHVTEAKAHSKDSPDSTLGIEFDQFMTKDGRQMPVKLAIQAIGKPLQNQVQGSDSLGETPGMIPGGTPRAGGTMGGPGMGGPSMGNPAGTQQPGSYPTPGSTEPRDAGGGIPTNATTIAPLGPTSQGVVGMRGLTLNSTGEAAVLSSSAQNVHLDSGTQLILRTQ